MTPKTSKTPPLSFASDPGAGRSKWVAAGLLGVVVLWMGSGLVLSSQDPTPRDGTAPKPVAIAVQVRTSHAESVTRHFVAKGQALPHRDTQVRAEASGNITKLMVQNGDMVKTGDAIALIDTAQYQANLTRAAEDHTRALRERDNAVTLRDRGAATNDRVLEAEAALAAAASTLLQAQTALADATITAPFAGRIEDLPIEQGEYIGAGEPAARIVDNVPLTVAIQVPQHLRARITQGAPAQVQFLTGEAAKGVIRFLGSSADADTRTFLAEIEVANDDGTIPAGVSADVIIATGDVTAHFMSPAILSLDDSGTLGVKTVTADNRVEFHVVNIASAGTDGIWVTGLPDQARLITVGQGYVKAGDLATPQDAAQ